MTEHARLFGYCKFPKGMETRNKEYASNNLSLEDTHNITPFGVLTTAERIKNRDRGIDGGPLGICTARAALTRYAPNSARLRTFSRWSKSCPVTASSLSDSGFYYTGFGDEVRCFFCFGTIRGWEENDDPWEEHARWFPDCSYLTTEKGQRYVDRVHKNTPDSKKCKRKTRMQQRLELEEAARLSDQKAMFRLCKKLGHSDRAVKRVLVENGRPFDNVKEMVEALYALEERDDEDKDGDDDSLDDTSASYPLQEKRDAILTGCQSGSGDPVRESERRTERGSGCKICESKSATFVKASHVGLPCGHLIYCDSCNADGGRESLDCQIKCPYPSCGAPLSATIRVFFA
jgi:hypothetical protein